jgi:hypothetical protein
MKNWIRIILVTSVSLGSAVLFGHWSFGQFNQALDTIDSNYHSYSANTNLAYQGLRIRIDTEQPQTTTGISLDIATSTNSGSSSSIPKLSFTFPERNAILYVGCVYPISWESSSGTDSFDVMLIDSNTKTPVEYKSSGLTKEHTIEGGEKSFHWRAGLVWPGTYYLSISKINGIPTDIQSEVFSIYKTPENIVTEERKNICKDSGGGL